MKFYEVQKALEEGNKIRRTSWAGSRLYFEDGKFYRAFDFQGSERYPIKDSDVLFNDWEIVEDIPEVKTNITLSETYTCPSCKRSDEYLPSQKEDVAKFGYFCCRCGKKIKPIMQTDEEILTYLKTELGRDFTTSDLKNVLVEISIHPPDIITLVNDKGVNIRFIKEK